MNDRVYRRLQEKVNEYGPGFPASSSGVELKILKLLFSEQDAEFYMKMDKHPESVNNISKRIGKDIDKTKKQLEGMLKKGSIFCRTVGDVRVYFPAPYLIGLYENLAERMDESIANLLEQYHKEVFFDQWADHVEKTQGLRFLPVQEALNSVTTVFPHDDAIAILKTKNKIAVIDCPCRKQLKLTGISTNPIEVCFSFDWLADYYVNDLKQGRALTIEEAMEIQKQCEQLGLINATSIEKDSIILCHCDKHCIHMRSLGSRNPADHFKSNYYSEVHSEDCIGCGMCLERCPIDAITIGQDQVAVIDLDRCIGCGLCVTGCTNEALSLKQKPDEKLLKKLV
ncbi:MAG: 4Fe-4S binding protein [Desulfobacterium sp.]